MAAAMTQAERRREAILAEVYAPPPVPLHRPKPSEDQVVALEEMLRLLRALVVEAEIARRERRQEARSA